MTPELEEYILNHIDTEPPHLKKLARDVNVYLLYPRMCSGHLQGRILNMLTTMIAPRRVLELGTYAAYSALSIAGALGDGAELHTIEVDDEMEDFIKERLDGAPGGEKVYLHIGDALQLIPELSKAGPWDLVFIDANKRHYVQYYETVMKYMRPGGYIFADNTLWDGKVTDPELNHDPQTRGIVDFNDLVANDSRVERVILPLRDGLTIIRVKP